MAFIYNWSISSLYRQYRVLILLHHQMSVNRAPIACHHSIISASTECQQSVNDFGYCIMYNPRALLWLISMIIVLAAVLSKSGRDMVTAPICTWTSTDRQWFCVLHHVWSNGCAMAFVHNWSIGSLYRQNRICWYRCIMYNPRAVLQLRPIINVLTAVLCKFDREIVTAPVWNERQQSVNNIVCCTVYNPRAVLRHLTIIEVFAAFIGNIVFVHTVTPQNEHQQCVKTASTERQQSINTVSTECQQSVNPFGRCIMYSPRVLLRHMSIINVSAAVLCKCDHDMVTAPVSKWASTERQRLFVLHLV